MVAVSSLRLMRKRGLIGALLALLFALSLGWPTQLQIPVAGAAPQDWNHDSFWAYPWGKSVVHKGIDIFAPHGSQVVAARWWPPARALCSIRARSPWEV